MRTLSRQDVDANTHSVNPTVDTQKVSENSVQVTPSQAEFLDLIRMHGYQELSQSLKTIHDLALYFSNSPVESIEKSALFDMKVLWKVLKKWEGRVIDKVQGDNLDNYPCLFTISLIQIGAKGEVQPLETG
jgi:hypothetical protein